VHASQLVDVCGPLVHPPCNPGAAARAGGNMHMQSVRRGAHWLARLEHVLCQVQHVLAQACRCAGRHVCTAAAVVLVCRQTSGVEGSCQVAPMYACVQVCCSCTGGSLAVMVLLCRDKVGKVADLVC
jgi:hypothetical protein